MAKDKSPGDSKPIAPEIPPTVPPRFPLIYLAGPYINPDFPGDTTVRDTNYRNICHATAILTVRGYCVYSPITHNHCIARDYGMPKDFKFWAKFDLNMLDRCDELWVLTLPRWKDSRGVAEEVAFAKARMKPVRYISLQEVLDIGEADG